jgi:hypothetical protein
VRETVRGKCSECGDDEPASLHVLRWQIDGQVRVAHCCNPCFNKLIRAVCLLQNAGASGTGFEAKEGEVAF